MFLFIAIIIVLYTTQKRNLYNAHQSTFELNATKKKKVYRVKEKKKKLIETYLI